MNEEKSRKKVKKILIAIFSCIVAAVLIYLVSLFAYDQIVRKPFLESIPEVHGAYLISKDGYSYSVSSLRRDFGFNLAITNEETTEGLIIWPKLMSDYSYAAEIKIDDNSDASGTQIIISIDKNGEFLGYPAAEKQSEIEAAEKAYQNNVDDIKDMLRRADEMWNLKEKDR